MPEVSPESLVSAIHDAGLRLVIAVTGGGSSAISTLLAVGGASRSILAAAVPYAEGALSEWLGATPEEFCSTCTARAMAMAAYEKARRYDPSGNCCGIGCTASLASDRPKRGAALRAFGVSNGQRHGHLLAGLGQGPAHTARGRTTGVGVGIESDCPSLPA